jgi:hypothetical protein
VEDPLVFRPPKLNGLIVHVAAIVIFGAASLWSIWQALHTQIGPLFLLYLLPGLLLAVLVPNLAYRAYALWRAAYFVEREGLRLHWGLRAEDIPMDQVIDVQPAAEVEGELPLPWLRIPGSVLGVRKRLDGSAVEFLAADPGRLVLIATPEKIFAISPEDPEKFLNAYRDRTELGSLSPIPAKSVRASFLLARVWATQGARYLLLGGLALSLLLLIWVSLVVPGRQLVPLGFDLEGNPGEPVPAIQLILLPILNGFFFLASFLVGLFFFRRRENEIDDGSAAPLAYILWGSGAFTALLFLGAVYFLLSAD